MSALLISEPPLQVLPSLAVKVGLNEAIILQQFHYWARNPTVTVDGHGWVSRSLADLEKAFPFWSGKTIHRAISNLRDEGYLRAFSASNNAFDKTLSYRVDHDKLGASIGTNCPDQIGTNCPNGDGQSVHVTIYKKEIREKKEKKASPAPEVDLVSWLKAIKEIGQQPITAQDPIFDYAEQAGIPDEFLGLAWRVFKDRHLESKKKYADWRAAFRNYVRQNWLGLWNIDREGTYYLTAVGKQAQAFYASRLKEAA